MRSQSERPQPSPGHVKVRLVLRELEASGLLANKHLDSIAQRLKISRAHLSRLIVRETGLSFSAHLRAKRARQAVALLGDLTLSIKEISAATGFEHVPSFDRWFRKAFGITPGQFRIHTMHGATTALQPRIAAAAAPQPSEALGV